MGLGYLDLPKILMILVVAMIVIGPDKLPRMARQMGSTLHNLQKMRLRLEQEMREAVPEVDLPRIARSPRGAVAGFVAGLATPSAKDGATTEAAAGGEVSDPGIALPGDEIGGEAADEGYADSDVYAEGPDGEQVWGESGWTSVSREDAATGSAAAIGSIGGGRDELVSADDPSMN